MKQSNSFINDLIGRNKKFTSNHPLINLTKVGKKFNKVTKHKKPLINLNKVDKKFNKVVKKMKKVVKRKKS